MEILVWLALASLPLAAIVAVSGATLGVAVRPGASTLVLAALVVVLLIAWVTTTYQAGVRADETGTGANIFSEAGWLAAALCAGALAGVLGLRPRARATGGRGQGREPRRASDLQSGET